MILCATFEEGLTDYLDGALPAVEQVGMAEHALRCPVCHELLNEIKANLQAFQQADVPVPPSPELAARIIAQTTPESVMACDEFEEYLTDYLDGFLPAALYHRWERHAALCQNCTDLPGQVVRSIGVCITYKNDELAAPAGLNARILQATLGTTDSEELRAPLTARLAAAVRAWLDPLLSPQLVTVASMLLLAIMVLTSTISRDGSLSDMYRATVELAGRSYEQSSAGLNFNSGTPGANLKDIGGEVRSVISVTPQTFNGNHATTANSNANTEQSKPNAADSGGQE